jgi:hypothetical protein
MGVIRSYYTIYSVMVLVRRVYVYVCGVFSFT